jgi:hypothetical protein
MFTPLLLRLLTVQAIILTFATQVVILIFIQNQGLCCLAEKYLPDLLLTVYHEASQKCHSISLCVICCSFHQLHNPRTSLTKTQNFITATFAMFWFSLKKMTLPSVLAILHRPSPNTSSAGECHPAMNDTNTPRPAFENTQQTRVWGRHEERKVLRQAGKRLGGPGKMGGGSLRGTTTMGCRRCLWRRDWVTPVCRRGAFGERRRAFAHAHNAGGQVGRLQLQPDGQSMGGRHCSHVKHIGVKACSCWRAARCSSRPRSREKAFTLATRGWGIWVLCIAVSSTEGGSARSAGGRTTRWEGG